jgi:hypothetical protein
MELVINSPTNWKAHYVTFSIPMLFQLVQVQMSILLGTSLSKCFPQSDRGLPAETQYYHTPVELQLCGGADSVFPLRIQIVVC